MIRPASGVMEKVIGIRMAIPIAAVKPGRAPKMIPMTTPNVAMNRLNGRKTFLRMCEIEAEIHRCYLFAFLDHISNPSGNQMYRSVWNATIQQRHPAQCDEKRL